jgi:glycosyltransferase involved in cell wall biosynthesis
MTGEAVTPLLPLLVVVVKGYPRISETFIAQELAGLERRGRRLLIVSLRRPYDALRHPVHAAVAAPVLYLPEYLRDAPGRVLRAHARLLGRAPGRYLGAALAWLRDLIRDPSPNRVRRFGQAGVLAAELPAAAAHLHAHFLHTPASVARYAGRLTGLGYSLSGHAKDVWTTPAWELAAKLREARFTVTCTGQNQARLQAVAPDAIVERVYHGLDRRLFAQPSESPRGSHRDGRDPADPVRCLAVGRFQPKKGWDVLLEALARIERHVVLTAVGYGPLETTLRAQAARLGLEGRIEWTGALDQVAVRERYRAADLFVMAARVAPDGDQDGLPNVVVEALSQGLPVVATRVAAIPEIVVDGENGRLVTPEDPRALARAVDALAGDPATRRRLAEGALRTVETGWDLERGLDRLGGLLGGVLAPPPAGRGATLTDPAPR